MVRERDARAPGRPKIIGLIDDERVALGMARKAVKGGPP